MTAGTRLFCGLLVYAAIDVGLSAGAPLHVRILAEGQGSSGYAMTLRSDDVEVRVDGELRRVESITRDARPASILLLVDMSASAQLGISRNRGQSWTLGDQALLSSFENGFAKRLPEGYRLRVARFAGSTVVVSERFAASQTEAAANVRKVLNPKAVDPGDALGPSPTTDVIARMSTLLANEPAPRVILLVTDGESSGNRLGVEEASRQAVINGVTVHVLTEVSSAMNAGGAQQMIRYPPGFQRDRLVQRLAELTGGISVRDDRFERHYGFSTPLPPFERFFDAMESTLTVRIAGDAPDGASLEIRGRTPRWRITSPHWLSKQ